MGIQISIKAGADAATSSVSASGSVHDIITDKERKTFGIEDAGLKSAVEKYFGKNPNDAYLHSLLHGTTFTKHTGRLKFKRYWMSRVQQ